MYRSVRMKFAISRKSTKNRHRNHYVFKVMHKITQYLKYVDKKVGNICDTYLFGAQNPRIIQGSIKGHKKNLSNKKEKYKHNSTIEHNMILLNSLKHISIQVNLDKKFYKIYSNSNSTPASHITTKYLIFVKNSFRSAVSNLV